MYECRISQRLCERVRTAIRSANFDLFDACLSDAINHNVVHRGRHLGDEPVNAAREIQGNGNDGDVGDADAEDGVDRMAVLLQLCAESHGTMRRFVGGTACVVPYPFRLVDGIVYCRIVEHVVNVLAYMPSFVRLKKSKARSGRHFPLAATTWFEATQLLFESIDVGNRSLLSIDGIV